MNPRLVKELRPLLFPWCVCAIASLGYLAGTVSNGSIRGALTGLAGFAFYLGCLVLAVLPVGLEFQERTLPLLVGQPIKRSRLWREKFLAATIAVLALVVVHGAMAAMAGQRLQSDDFLPCVGFVVATICSAGLLTLTARSVIGGMVLAGAGQFAIMGTVTGIIYLFYKLAGRDPFDPEMDKGPVLTTYICAGAIYSALALWLGWRTFAEMEVRDAPASADLALPDRFTPRKLAAIFRCQPTGSLQNLIRKEVGLQKPIFTIGAVFGVCWIIAFLLLLLEPSQRSIYVGVLNALTGIHITIVALLTGCISIGEEKTLGLAAWHLTLPVSSRRQWFVKFAVACTTAALVGVILPLIFSCLTLVKAKTGLTALANGEIWGSLLVLAAIWVLVALGIWCASFWENTVRAALSTIVSLIGLGTFALLGAWVASQNSPGLQTDLVSSLVGHEAVLPYSIALVVLLVTFVALLQSLSQFRRARSSSALMLKYSLILALITFAGAYWCADLTKSIEQDQLPSQELRERSP